MFEKQASSRLNTLNSHGRLSKHPQTESSRNSFSRMINTRRGTVQGSCLALNPLTSKSKDLLPYAAHVHLLRVDCGAWRQRRPGKVACCAVLRVNSHYHIASSGTCVTGLHQKAIHFKITAICAARNSCFLHTLPLDACVSAKHAGKCSQGLFLFPQFNHSFMLETAELQECCLLWGMRA